MRVLHVMGSLDFGGIERLVSDLAVSQKNGLNVSLLVDKKGGAYQKIIENDIPLFISLIEGGYDFSYEKYKYLRDVFSQFDIVHFHSFSILKFLALIDCKVVYTIHGLSKGVRSENFFKFHLRESIKKYFLNKVDFFISNSNYTMDLSKKHYGLKSYSKGSNFKRHYKNITYEKNTNSNDTFTVGLVSRFTRKRIEYLVNAFNEFIKMGGKW